MSPAAMIPHCTLVVLAAAAPLFAQAPRPSAPSPEFVPIAGVIQVINDDAITAARLDREIQLLLRKYPVTTQEDHEKLVALARRRVVDERLQTQAGENLGLDEKEVERRGKLIREKQKEKGLDLLAEDLQKQGLDAAGAQRSMRDRTYQASWFYPAIGELQGVRGRFWRDTYVRPGELLHAYQQSKADLAEPDRVVLQLLDVSAADNGGMDRARKAIDQACEDVAAGRMTFDDCVDEMSQARGSRGVQREMAVEDIGVDELRSFARSAAVGQVSERMPWVTDGVQKGWRVAKLVERRAGKPAPAFEDSVLQQRLRESVQEKRTQLRLEDASARMLRRAWLWPKPQAKRNALGGPAADSKPAR
ncbi:MAG: hypothetical protein EPO68_12010 [Planctomycetota bacterium]|nr:MAG: hypothetical protein EPO68_12010 [Planctomycetota bacterium]